jgi:hypothetical protein
MGLGNWLRGRRKSDQGDLYRPLSPTENELVEHDVAERSKYDQAPAAATPDAPVNADGVDGLDLPLTEGERELVEREVEEQPRPDAG